MQRRLATVIGELLQRDATMRTIDRGERARAARQLRRKHVAKVVDAGDVPWPERAITIAPPQAQVHRGAVHDVDEVQFAITIKVDEREAVGVVLERLDRRQDRVVGDMRDPAQAAARHGHEILLAIPIEVATQEAKTAPAKAKVQRLFRRRTRFAKLQPAAAIDHQDRGLALAVDALAIDVREGITGDLAVRRNGFHHRFGALGAQNAQPGAARIDDNGFEVAIAIEIGDLQVADALPEFGHERAFKPEARAQFDGDWRRGALRGPGRGERQCREEHRNLGLHPGRNLWFPQCSWQP